MKKLVTLLLTLLFCISLSTILIGCSSDTYEEPAPEDVETVEEDYDEIETEGTEDAQMEEDTQEDTDQYAYVEQYLSDFHTIDGGGYVVTVDDSISDDFTTLKDCALYTYKKGYEEYGTLDLGIFGNYDNGYPAFSYDAAYGNTTMQFFKDMVVPPGWEWLLTSSDIKYVMGED